MHIYVDADACPVVPVIEKIAMKYKTGVTLLCDTNHVIHSDYSQVRTVSSGPDAVDFELVNLCQEGDVVVTQDYGVAAMALGKRAYAIHQSGRIFTEENIDQLLMERYVAREARRRSSRRHIKKQKRTDNDKLSFEESFEKLLRSGNGGVHEKENA